jgi:hypothetical protein
LDEPVGGTTVGACVSVRNSDYQFARQFCVGIFSDVDHRARDGGSALAAARSGGILWWVHDLFELPLRDDSLFPAGAGGQMAANFVANNLLACELLFQTDTRSGTLPTNNFLTPKPSTFQPTDPPTRIVASQSHAVFSHSGLNHFFGKSECPAILMFAAPTYG